jgi:hypothetical protein
MAKRITPLASCPPIFESPPGADLWLPLQLPFGFEHRSFNERRPHEALANTQRSDHYTRSARPLPSRLPLLEYPADVELRRVTSTISWRTTRLLLSTTLAGEYVSLRKMAHGEWTIAFEPLTLGISTSALAFHEAPACTPGTR